METQKNTVRDSYKAFGRIELDYSSYQFSGDMAVYGDRSSFNIEVFSFGNLIFKLQEKEGLFSLYYMNRQLNAENGFVEFLPLGISDLKRVVSDFIRKGGRGLSSLGDVSILTDKTDEFRILELSAPNKGSVKFYLSKDI